jgi:long-chain fatty acid transport protein
MSQTIKKSLSLMLLALVSTGSAWATNGYFAHGYSAKEKGRAGTGVARGADSLSSATNPANLLDVGDRLEAGASFFMPFRSYTITGGPSAQAAVPVFGPGGYCPQPGVVPCQIPFSLTPGKVESGSEFFLIPSFGYAKQVSDTMAWGVAVYGNGGMNSDYSAGSASASLFNGNPTAPSIVTAPGSFGSGKAGVDLIQLFINTSMAYKATEKLSLGAGIIIAVQSFEALGLGPFANNSLDATALTDNGHDMSYGFGFKLGATYHASDVLSFAFSYQTEMKMSEFDDYAGLFAEGGDFNIPSTYTVGFAWDNSPNSTFYFDLQEISYSDVKSINNGIAPLVNGSCADALNNFLFSGLPSPATGNGCLGGSDGAGFGWDDVTVYKFGYEWGSDNSQYRVGYSTTEQPIDSGELNFNILAPGVVEDHFTAGYTMVTENKNEWDFHFMYAPEVEVSGSSLFDPAQTITIRMDQIDLGFSYKF